MRFRLFAMALVVSVVVAALLAACGDAPDDALPADDSGSPESTTTRPIEGGVDSSVTAELGLDKRPVNATCKPPKRPPSTSPVKFEQVYVGLYLDGPMVIEKAPADPTRWFAALRKGAIASFPATNPVTATQVADLNALSGLVVDYDGEDGLLGMAFHPKFAQNGKLYVSFTAKDGVDPNTIRSHVGVLTSPDNGATFTSYADVLVFDNTDSPAHKGGTVRFGKDGFLYASFGDGGSADDGYYHGQKTTGFFAKILRIDVDHPAGGKNYGIPAGNPYQGNPDGGEPETFAMGFRNPFRFSIDRATGDLWVADVGQDQFEEIDKVVAGGNYGWPCREGQHDYIVPTAEAAQVPPTKGIDPDRCFSLTGLTDPVAEYPHDGVGAAVIGGVVYRGRALPAFVGSYVFGDYSRFAAGTLSFDPSTGKPVVVFPLTSSQPEPWGSFAEDEDGEIFGVSLNGYIYKLVADDNGEGGPVSDSFPDRLSKTGCVDPSAPKNVSSGLVPYAVNDPFWSDGADKRRWMALPDGATITVTTSGDFTYPIGTVMMKEFSLGGRRIETRLLMRHDDGGWAGYSYEWLDDESDAMLLPSSKAKTVGSQIWSYPSRSDCVRCHTEVAGHTLGPELGQLNGDFLYPATNRTANQLKTLDHIGMFASPLGKDPGQILAYPDTFGSAPVETRARAYLHANCSQCHQPGGPGGGDMDFRFAIPLHDMKICNVAPQRGDLGVTGAKLLVPGSPAKSMISIRPHGLLGSQRMPPLASSVVDAKGTGVLDAWISSVATCP